MLPAKAPIQCRFAAPALAPFRSFDRRTGLNLCEKGNINKARLVDFLSRALIFAVPPMQPSNTHADNNLVWQLKMPFLRTLMHLLQLIEKTI